MRQPRERHLGEAAVRPHWNAADIRCDARPKTLRPPRQRALDARLPADAHRTDRARRILRGVRPVRSGVRLAARRDDGRPAQALRRRKRAVRRVHGLVVVPERPREIRQGHCHRKRRCVKARGARGKRAYRMRRGETQRLGGRPRQDQRRTGMRCREHTSRLRCRLPLYRPGLPRQHARRGVRPDRHRRRAGSARNRAWSDSISSGPKTI